MSKQATKNKILTNVTLSVKFVTVADTDSTLGDLRRRIVKLLQNHYGMNVSRTRLGTKDGYRLFDEDLVGDVLSEGDQLNVELDPKYLSISDRSSSGKSSAFTTETPACRPDHLRTKDRPKLANKALTSEKHRPSEQKRVIEHKDPAKDRHTPDMPVQAPHEISTAQPEKKIKTTPEQESTKTQSIVSTEKEPTFEPSFKGFAVRRREIEGIKTGGSGFQSNFVPLKKKKQEDTFEEI